MPAPQLDSVPFGIVLTGLYHHYDVGNQASYPGSGTTIYDLQGNLNQNSTTTTFNGVAGNLSSNEYFSFSGANSWSISPPTGAFIRKLGRSDTPFTIDAWMYRSTGKAPPLVDNMYAAAGNGFIHTFDGTDKHVLFKGLNLSITTTLTLNQNNSWHYVGLSVDPVTQVYTIIQANSSGVQSTSGAYVAAWTTGESASYYFIGRSGDVYAFTGSRMSIWRLYNRALSTDEMSMNFSAQRGRFGV